MKAFPSEDEGGPGRVLFRVEEANGCEPVMVLVQSWKAPDWSWLQSLEGYLASGVAVKEFSPSLALGQRLRFRLRANPTMRRSSDKRRLGFFKEEDQLKWLQRKGETGGFRLLRCQVVPKGKHDQGVIHREEKAHHVHMLGVLFEGTLEITDPQQFLNRSIAAGIGSGKAFGFGLLSVAPYHRSQG
jgi:CRISPR system Cascade subunit CasE